MCQWDVEMVGTGRFELPACRLGGDRSIHLSYVPGTNSLPALQAFPADVSAVMHSVEVNLAHFCVGIGDGFFE